MQPARTRRRDFRVLALLIPALAGGCSRDPVASAPAVQQVAASAPSVPVASARPIRCGVYMRNVDLHLLEGVVLRVATLEGELVDADGRDRFDFYPGRYRAQLVAGYSKNTERGGLRTVMPD